MNSFPSKGDLPHILHKIPENGEGSLQNVKDDSGAEYIALGSEFRVDVGVGVDNFRSNEAWGSTPFEKIVFKAAI